MKAAIGYSWAYGWELVYETNLDLTEATAVAHRLTAADAPEPLIISAVKAEIPGGWSITSVIAQAGDVPAGDYVWQPQVDFGETVRLPLEAVVLRIF